MTDEEFFPLVAKTAKVFYSIAVWRSLFCLFFKEIWEDGELGN